MRNKILVVVLILFFGLIFVISGLADLYIVKDQEGEIVAISNQDIFKAEYQELGYTFELWLKTIEKTLTFDSIVKRIESQLSGERRGDIKIVDWTNYLGGTGNYYYVEGILQNVGRSKVEYLQVKVIAYDRSKKLVTLKESYANPHALAPGEEATFKIMIKYNERIDNFELKLNWKED